MRILPSMQNIHNLNTRYVNNPRGLFGGAADSGNETNPYSVDIFKTLWYDMQICIR